MSQGTAYTYPTTGYTAAYDAYAPQQYSYPAQQYSYPAQQYSYSAQQYSYPTQQYPYAAQQYTNADQYAYYAQQYGVGGSCLPNTSQAPSQPMGRSNGHVSGAHSSAGVPIVEPKPVRTHASVLNAQPELRAANVMRSFEVEGDKVHFYEYTGKKVRVPLPAGVDPKWSWEVYSLLPPNSGKPLVFHGLELPEEVEDLEDLIEMINRKVMNAHMPLSALNVHANDIYVHRGLLPFEGFDFESCDMMTNCLHSPDGVEPTVGLLLSKMIYSQYVWHENLTSKENTVWFVHGDNKVWGRWAENPRLDCLFIRSIRRTLPDANGVVYYFPELQLMPMALNRKTSPAPGQTAPGELQ
ncbi:hypothetical protein FKP32DRAFT_1599350 [Trametes sanguinea]|nr:hypothetical protein FKP32DRAFT_1599350 [Trametes sanguinea]